MVTDGLDLWEREARSAPAGPPEAQRRRLSRPHLEDHAAGLDAVAAADALGVAVDRGGIGRVGRLALERLAEALGVDVHGADLLARPALDARRRLVAEHDADGRARRDV